MKQRDKESDWKRLARILNSTIAFCLSFVLLSYLGFWSMALVGHLFGLNATVYYYGIKFIMNDEKWTRLNILFIFSAPVIFQLLWGFISLYIYDKTQRNNTILNLLLLWNYTLGIVFGLTHFFSAILGFNEYNSPFYHTISVVYAWFRIPKVIAIGGVIAAATLLVYLSLTTIRPFLKLAFSFSKVNQINRKRKYYMEVAGIPAIVGLMFCVYYTFPMNFYMTALTGVLLLAVMSINFYMLNYTQITLEEVNRFELLQKLNFPLFVVASTILVLIFLIRTGVNF